MQKYCSGCGSTRFRLSHFRLEDVPWLLVLHYPIRCRECSHRTYAFVGWFAARARRKLLDLRARRRNAR